MGYESFDINDDCHSHCTLNTYSNLYMSSTVYTAFLSGMESVTVQQLFAYTNHIDVSAAARKMKYEKSAPTHHSVFCVTVSSRGIPKLGRRQPTSI